MTSRKTSLPKPIRVVVLVGVCLLLVVINHRVASSFVGNWANKDFMSLWAGGRAVAMGLDPYDPEVWPHLRMHYGSQWIPDPTCPFPLWTLLAMVPLSLLPLDVAAAILMIISQVAVVGSVALILGASGRCITRQGLLGAAIGASLFRPLIATLLNGQMTALLTLLIASGVFLYKRERSFEAGLAFAMLLLKPNLFILFFAALGLLLLTRRDWQALLGVASGCGGLLGISWLVMPRWIPQWLAVTGKTSVVFGTPSIWGLVSSFVVREYWMWVGTAAVGLISAITLLGIVRRKDAWLAGLGLAVCASLLVTPYLWAYDQFLLLIPALIAFQYYDSPAFVRATGWWSAAVVLPWVLFWVAHLRGSDSLGGLVALGIAGYLFVSWRLSEICAT